MTSNEPIGPDCRTKYSRDWGVNYPWFRTYNESMLEWLSCINLNIPEHTRDVPVVYATPERAFADYVRPRVEGQTDLPAISFVLTAVEFDQERFRPPFLPFSKQRVGDKWQLGSRAMPWTFNYNVTLWAAYNLHLDIINYTIMSRFTPKSWLLVQGRPSEIEFAGHSDNSELEPGADQDRTLRHDLQFKVDGWMPLPFREVGQIEKSLVVIDNEVPGGSFSSDDYDLSGDPPVVAEGDFDIQSDGTGQNQSPGVFFEEEGQ